MKGLNLQQERFCQLYATDVEFFGNGVETYLEVYDIDKTNKNWYKTACVCASKLLSNDKVIARINELLDSQGLNDGHIDKQLLFLINQFSDFGSKIAAIREYNKLKQRITEKTDITTGGKPLIDPNDIFSFISNLRKSDSRVRNSGKGK
jgi:hypothetical protein